MNKKPFFRTLDGCWYAYRQVGTKRKQVKLKDKAGEAVTPAALKYVNRLSDFLFVAGRHANDKGASDVLWQPGKNR